MSDQTAATDLAFVLKAVRDAVGALSAQADQIGQMRGMFGDEDGAIQTAVDAGEEAETGLNAAAAMIATLLAPVEGSPRHPTAGELLAFRERIGDGSTALDPDDAGRLPELLRRAALAASEPIEIAIHVDGGAVQGVTRTTQEDRPAIVYVHDHDVEGDDDADDELASIRFDNSKGEHDVDECSLSLHDGGTWETASTDGHYWTSLRAEAERLGLTA